MKMNQSLILVLFGGNSYERYANIKLVSMDKKSFH